MATSHAPAVVDRVVDAVVDSGRVPDAVLRRAVRTLLRRRLRQVTAGSPAQRMATKTAMVELLRHQAVALATDTANEQHYEVPPALFELMLGPRMKYSACLWDEGITSLAAAEEAMLALTVERAELRDGQDVLELGCGWGSLTLYVAERFPGSRITAVSNSSSQREHVVEQAARRGLANVTVLTADVNVLELPDDGWDRVVSVEMFEHVRNHEVLLARIARWLRADGALFVHHFAHRDAIYPFDVGRRGDWMARHFFTDGLMPSDDLLLHFPRDLHVVRRWVVDGTHYARTCEAWLDNLDAHADAARAVLGEAYGADVADAWLQRWRVFDLACAELFAFDRGRQWWVTHVLLRS